MMGLQAYETESKRVILLAMNQNCIHNNETNLAS